MSCGPPVNGRPMRLPRRSAGWPISARATSRWTWRWTRPASTTTSPPAALALRAASPPARASSRRPPSSACTVAAEPPSTCTVAVSPEAAKNPLSCASQPTAWTGEARASPSASVASGGEGAAARRQPAAPPRTASAAMRKAPARRGRTRPRGAAGWRLRGAVPFSSPRPAPWP